MAGVGSVFFRKSDSRWVGKYYVTDPFTNKTKPKYVYCSKQGRKGQQEVRRKLNAIIEEAEAGDLSNTQTITVAGWLHKYLDIYCDGLEETTKEGYKRYMDNHIIPYIGNIKLKDLKAIHIQNFYKHERNVPRYKTKEEDGKQVAVLEHGKPVPLIKNGEPVFGYSEKTILQEHRILNRAFKKAQVDGFLKRNPCEGVDAPSPEEHEPEIYNEDDYNLLLNKLIGNKLEIIVLLSGMCGLRRGEMLGLTWDDIDLENGIMNVERNTVPTQKGTITKKPKTKKSTRKFAISPAIIPRLKQLRGVGKVLTKRDGREYQPGSVSRMFKEFLDNNGLKPTTLHKLRHFNATMMLKYGVPEKETEERLGHSNSTMTKKYQHILQEMDRESAKKLDGVIKVSDKVSKVNHDFK
jgi:integrase